jgi:hypothetical protein
VGPYFNSVTGVLTEGWTDGPASAKIETPREAARITADFVFTMDS